jgi:AcrR family transcriptional regulator
MASASTFSNGSDTQLKRKVGRPSQLSLGQILAAASKVGLTNLTLQAVADVLGVTPPALYNHIEGREDLISKFVADVMDKFPVPAYQGEGWANWAAGYAASLLAMYEAVPGLADYTIRRTSTVTSVLDRHEMSIMAAKESGFSDLEALYATRAIIEFVAGWVARKERRDALERELKVHPDEEFRNYVIQKGRDEYPHLKGALKAATSLNLSHRFEFTLRALIGGLEVSISDAHCRKTGKHV